MLLFFYCLFVFFFFLIISANYCHYYYQLASGKISMPVNQQPVNYGDSQTCTWALEAPLGSNIFINVSIVFSLNIGTPTKFQQVNFTTCSMCLNTACLLTAGCMTNSVDPEQMLHSVPSDLGLYFCSILMVIIA